jgi:ribonuclease G
MSVPVLEQCPVCRGSGEIKSSYMLMDDIENNLNYLIQEQNEQSLTLSVHPYVAAYLTKGIRSIQVNWYLKYKKWIKVRPAKGYHLLEYQFFNGNNDVIKS